MLLDAKEKRRKRQHTQRRMSKKEAESSNDVSILTKVFRKQKYTIDLLNYPSHSALGQIVQYS